MRILCLAFSICPFHVRTKSLNTRLPGAHRLAPHTPGFSQTTFTLSFTNNHSAECLPTEKFCNLQQNVPLYRCTGCRRGRRYLLSCSPRAVFCCSMAAHHRHLHRHLASARPHLHYPLLSLQKSKKILVVPVTTFGVLLQRGYSPGLGLLFLEGLHSLLSCFVCLCLLLCLLHRCSVVDLSFCKLDMG